MPNLLIPTILSRGIIDQDNFVTAVAATKVFSSLDDETRGIAVLAHSGNANDTFIGSSTVSTAGADRGWPISGNEHITAAITGQGADEFYQINAAATDNLLAMQFG